MIDRAALLTDLQKLLRRLEADLLERSESAEVPQVGESLRGEYQRAFAAQRTAQNYADWRADAITQAAAAWVLSSVFVRFLEDNGLIDPPRLAGPGDRLARARDEHELYFRTHPKHSDREYLWSLFDQLAGLPGTRDVFGPHNPLRELPNWLSGDAAGELVKFFRKINVETGQVVHDFTDPAWDTRFLGDLYQDLSEAARKKYALLQTPDFVEEFILDRTLTPALDEFGLEAPAVLDPNGKPVTAPGFRMIDPACGSGHFLLGAFPRLLDRWQRREPGTNLRELVQRTLDSICGVDVNPYAVAIARFRLLLAAMQACGIRRLADAPGFRLNLACGDSLLHAPLKSGQQVFDFERSNADVDCDHAYQSEDLPTLKRLLRGGQYHAVVANPPYITPKDRGLNERYRKRYTTCIMKYSLAVPFIERIRQLSIAGGYSGQITANSFMKREFGRDLINKFFPSLDLTHVIDLSGGGGAHIPGHKTGTVILFSRNRLPHGPTVRTAMGIRGEPSTPVEPAKGLVWTSIVDQIDHAGSRSEYISVDDVPREQFHEHPWSLGGGGIAQLKSRLDETATATLSAHVSSVGITLFTLADDFFFMPQMALKRQAINSGFQKSIVTGETVRDWRVDSDEWVVFPYDEYYQPTLGLEKGATLLSFMWPMRCVLGNSKMFSGKTKVETGLKWYEFGRLTAHKLQTPYSVVFASVATHNHFCLDRGGRVFHQSAPIIKFSEDLKAEQIYTILGLLNSSVACFWMKQVFYPKATATGDISSVKGKPEANRYDLSSTGLEKFPVPSDLQSKISAQIGWLAMELDVNAKILNSLLPSHFLNAWRKDDSRRLPEIIAEARENHEKVSQRMISIQEELDWACYSAFGLIDDAPELKIDNANPIGIGAMSRPFAWEDDTAEPHVPQELKKVFTARRHLISKVHDLQLIETHMFKRPWWGRQGVYGRFVRDFDGLVTISLCSWLLDRLESYFDFDGRMNDNGHPTARLDVALVSVARLADIARQDPEFQEVGALYRHDAAFDVEALVAELVAGESVPLLPVLRYKPSGLIKRQAWEQTWDLQRQEDAIDARTSLPASDPQCLSADAARQLKQAQVGTIAVPPKYDSKDFLSSDFWRLRGKLDVPKERWISFPHCEGADGTPVIAWAGYNHLQLAQSISGYFVEIQERLGGRDDPRLIPLLACLLELLPWLKQWHNEVDPEFGMAMGDYFEGFISEEARQLGQTLPEIKAWTPPKKAPRAAQATKAKKPPRKKSSTPEPEPQ